MNLEEINKLVGSDKRQQLIEALQYCMRSEKFYGRLVIDDNVKANNFKFLGSRVENMNLLEVKCLFDVIAIILITKNMGLLSRKEFLGKIAYGEHKYITPNFSRQNRVNVNIESLVTFYKEKKVQPISMFLHSIDDAPIMLDVEKLQTFQNESRELLGGGLPEEFFSKGEVKQEKKEQTVFRIIILRELIRRLEDSTDLLGNENFKNVNTSFLGVPKTSQKSERIFTDFRKRLESIKDNNKINEEVEHILIDVCFPVITDDKLRDFIKQVERISLLIKLSLKEAEKLGQRYSSIMSASGKLKEDLANLLNHIEESNNENIKCNEKKLYGLEKDAKIINMEAKRRYRFDEKYKF